MKKIFVFLSLILCLNFANAAISNSVIAVVETEPITEFELNEVMKKNRISPNDALEILISQKLQNAEIKRRSILVSEYEVDKRVEAIAKQNNFSKEQFLDVLKKQKINYADFRQNVRKSLMDEKLYGSIYAEVAKKVTKENVKRFYDENPGLFSTFDSVTLTRFVSKNPNLLNQILKNKNLRPNGVQTMSGTLNAKQMDEGLRHLVAPINVGEFTQIFPTRNGYEMFYVNSKKGVNKVNFEDVQQQAIEAYTIKERKKAVDEFHQRLRSNAAIKILKK